ncbi:MAG: type II toxin-antitoxin system VapC family toxin [Thiolinea sp.]
MLYIVDSSVFNKLYLEEPGSEQARHLFTRAQQREVRLLAPDLLRLEVLNTAQRAGVAVDKIAELIDRLTPLIEIRPVTDDEYRKAIEIMQQGHDKSGYPSIYDSLFHAMAFCNDGVLVTADRRHLVKTETLGKVTKLADLMA